MSQNVPISNVTYADHKEAYTAWHELSQQLDICGCLLLMVRCTQSLPLYLGVQLLVRTNSLSANHMAETQ